MVYYLINLLTKPLYNAQNNYFDAELCNVLLLSLLLLLNTRNTAISNRELSDLQTNTFLTKTAKSFSTPLS